ncbi:hypothetical protein [Achromobacter mucicolens]|uniref:hypothetical protein n=1 Tax=Achromobacter mucicolens TaxID=1389922 RepID=UPI001CC0BA75|nr:hypothetical protein [Achromobacter mucicolens]UAN04418.1 hypothetical protein K9D24_09890 [Achromobacter mucicolens]
MTDKDKAIQEAERIAAADEYFKARAWLMDTTDNRRIFEAGFDRAYALPSKLRAPVADERAAFEADFLRRFNKPGLLGWEDVGMFAGTFGHALTRARWEGWQARAALASAPVAGEAQPVAEVVSRYGDPEAFGERDLKVLVDLNSYPYGAKFYAAPQASEAHGGDHFRGVTKMVGVSEAVESDQPDIETLRRVGAARDAGIAASVDVELPPLPSPPQHRGHAMFAGSQMIAYAHAAVLADRQRDAIAWESTTPAYIMFITDSRYRKFSPAVRKWYRPYRCASCAALSAQPGAQKGGSDA